MYCADCGARLERNPIPGYAYGVTLSCPNCDRGRI